MFVGGGFPPVPPLDETLQMHDKVDPRANRLIEESGHVLTTIMHVGTWQNLYLG